MYTFKVTMNEWVYHLIKKKQKKTPKPIPKMLREGKTPLMIQALFFTFMKPVQTMH